MREELWRSDDPAAGADRRVDRLRRLPGGTRSPAAFNRNIVLRAAYLAAHDQRAIATEHLTTAAEMEYRDRGSLATRGRLLSRRATEVSMDRDKQPDTTTTTTTDPVTAEPTAGQPSTSLHAQAVMRRATQRRREAVPLDGDVRGRMEASLGADFSSVRVHESEAVREAEPTRTLGGNDLYFAPGEYAPGSEDGDALIGHAGRRRAAARRPGERTAGPRWRDRQ